MRRVFIGFFYLICISLSQTFAQSAHVTATVNLHLSGTVSLTKVRDLNMGFVMQGVTSATIDPTTGGRQTAYFIFSGEPDLPIFVSFSSSNLTSGADHITFTGALAGGTSSIQDDPSLIANGDPIITGSDGTYCFWAGGTATLSPTQPFGIYSGDFTLSIAY